VATLAEKYLATEKAKATRASNKPKGAVAKAPALTVSSDANAAAAAPKPDPARMPPPGT
jgi:hypothetical protein